MDKQAIGPKLNLEEREIKQKHRVQKKNKTYYQKTKEKQLANYHDTKTYIICDCGMLLFDKSKTDHNSSKWHLNYMNVMNTMKNNQIEAVLAATLKKNDELTAKLKDTDRRYAKIIKYMKYAFMMEDKYGYKAIMKICPDCQYVSAGGREWASHFISNRHVYCVFRKHHMF